MINYSSISDAWGNKTYRNNKMVNNTNSEKFTTTVETKVDKQVDKQIDNQVNNVKQLHESFNGCNMVDHLKNCAECKKKLQEFFINSDNSNDVNFFGITFSKDIGKIIFIIIIVIIFILILSIINFSIKQSQMKYIISPNDMKYMQNMFMPNMFKQ